MKNVVLAVAGVVLGGCWAFVVGSFIYLFLLV